MDIRTIKKMRKQAIKTSRLDFVKLGFAILFMASVLVYSFLGSSGLSNNVFLAIGALFGAYMAMNIGANDVANNVGPAVGSKALTMGGAILIAIIFESAGAFIAGGDVVQTIKKGIIDIEAFGGDTNSFIWAMMAALLSAALWLNFATFVKAPVSTTHSIVGGVMGAGIASAGFSIVSWSTMSKIAISWVVSPVLGGIIAAIFLFSIKKTILFKENKKESAIFWVPIYVAIMSWAFVVYLTLKGLKKIWPDIVNILTFLPQTNKPSFFVASMFGLLIAIIVYIATNRILKIKSDKIKNNKYGVNRLFTIPLIFAAALLSFAHGANDVANAIGPLAAISDAISNGTISSSAGIPIWVMAIGAIGISLGLLLYGPKLIKTVGGEITELNRMRAFSVAMAASITVIIASQLGLPVSSTHIAIGGIFGVGFLREALNYTNFEKKIEKSKETVEDEEKHLKAFKTEINLLHDKDKKDKSDYKRVVKLYMLIENEEKKLADAKKNLKNVKNIRYVKRSELKKIVAAWIITVPMASILSAMIYFTIRGIML
jgi:PiT family inorganic phosphate transporter